MASGKRVWDFVVWCESADPDFEKKLKASHIRCNYIKHDRDFNEDGTHKKPHWQGVLELEGPQPYKKVLEWMKEFAGAGINTIEAAKTKHGSLCYLIHAYDQDKAQYKPSEVISINGADYVQDIISSDDKDKYDSEIKIFIHRNKITHFSDLSDIATFLIPEWHNNVDNFPAKWRQYLMSFEDKLQNNIITKFDSELEGLWNDN